MKIAHVKVSQISSSYWGQEFASRQDGLELVTLMSGYEKYRRPLSSWFAPDTMCVVEIQTDDGLVGTGWCEDYCQTSSNIVSQHLARFLIGADPLDRVVLWDQMYRSTVPFGRLGPAMFGISAVDIALWDLAGKYLDQPVHRLLGSQVDPSVSVYASHLYYSNEDQFVSEALEYVARGFSAMKMRFPHGPSDGLQGLRRNVSLVRLLRENVGDEIELMADAYMGWDLEYALAMCRGVAPFGMAWLEEPLMPGDVGAYAELRKASPVAIAAGEHESTLYGFSQLIAAKAIDIVQIDVGRVGGVSEARRVCALADSMGLPVYAHGYGLPTLHLAASEPIMRMAEYFPVPVWDDAIEGPNFDGAGMPINGEVRLNSEPGLGAVLSLPGFSPLE